MARYTIDSTLPVIPTRSEMIHLFSLGKSDLQILMACIDSLQIFQRKCILRYLGYIAPQTPTSQWLANEKISDKLFRTTLSQAFKLLPALLTNPPHNQPSIAEVIASCTNHRVTKSARGKALGAQSRMLRLLKLHEIAPPASLTQREQLILDAVKNHFTSTGTVLDIADLAQILDLEYTTIQGLISFLLKWDFVEARYATKDYTIARGSSRWKAIEWYQSNYSQPQAILQLLTLSELHWKVFMMSVTPVEGYYITAEEICSLLNMPYDTLANNGSKFYAILKKALIHIQTDYSVQTFLENLYRQIDVSNDPEIVMVRQELINRIESHTPIGHGTFKAIANKLGIKSGI